MKKCWSWKSAAWTLILLLILALVPACFALTSTATGMFTATLITALITLPTMKTAASRLGSTNFIIKSGSFAEPLFHLTNIKIYKKI